MVVSEYTKSLKTYGYSILGAHAVAFTYLFPYIVFCIVFSFIIFYVMFIWCSLIDDIEEANRRVLVEMIATCESKTARDNLQFQLYMHDKHSMFGQDPIDGVRV